MDYEQHSKLKIKLDNFELEIKGREEFIIDRISNLQPTLEIINMQYNSK